MVKTGPILKKVIIVKNGVPTSYMWRKNEEKGPILSENSEYKNCEKYIIGVKAYHRQTDRQMDKFFDTIYRGVQIFPFR